MAGIAYTNGVAGEALPVDAGTARAAVTDYLRRIGAFRDHPDLRVEVQVDATSVTVVLRARTDLPLTMPGAPGSAEFSATGAAVTTVDP